MIAILKIVKSSSNCHIFKLPHLQIFKLPHLQIAASSNLQIAASSNCVLSYIEIQYLFITQPGNQVIAFVYRSYTGRCTGEDKVSGFKGKKF